MCQFACRFLCGKLKKPQSTTQDKTADFIKTGADLFLKPLRNCWHASGKDFQATETTLFPSHSFPVLHAERLCGNSDVVWTHVLSDHIGTDLTYPLYMQINTYWDKHCFSHKERNVSMCIIWRINTKKSLWAWGLQRKWWNQLKQLSNTL